MGRVCWWAACCVLLVGCNWRSISTAPKEEKHPGKPIHLAKRYWPHAYELCDPGEPYSTCFDTLWIASGRTKENRPPRGDLQRLREAANLLCGDVSWEDCFARLEPPESAPATSASASTTDTDVCKSCPPKPCR